MTVFYLHPIRLLRIYNIPIGKLRPKCSDTTYIPAIINMGLK